MHIPLVSSTELAVNLAGGLWERRLAVRMTDFTFSGSSRHTAQPWLSNREAAGRARHTRVAVDAELALAQRVRHGGR